MTKTRSPGFEMPSDDKSVKSDPAKVLPEIDEKKAKTVWPTIGATTAGRFVGRMAAIPVGLGAFFTVGTLMAIATIPVAVVVFAWQLMPVVCRRYTLTNRRLIVQHGLSAVDGESLSLDGFDDIEVQVLPGQQWLHAGELRFLSGGKEVFYLAGVGRPEVFRQSCLNARHALVSVREVLKQQGDQAVAS